MTLLYLFPPSGQQFSSRHRIKSRCQPCRGKSALCELQKSTETQEGREKFGPMINPESHRHPKSPKISRQTSGILLIMLLAMVMAGLAGCAAAVIPSGSNPPPPAQLQIANS